MDPGLRDVTWVCGRNDGCPALAAAGWQVRKQADHRGDWALVLTNVIVDLTRAGARKVVRLYPERITSTPKPRRTQLTSFQIKNANRHKGEVGHSAGRIIILD